MKLRYHLRLKYSRTISEVIRDLALAIRAAAHRWYVQDFCDWMDRQTWRRP